MPSIWDQLVEAICRPPRDEYTVEQLFGGNNGVFMVNKMESCRCDFELVNKKGQKLQCSHYLPLSVQGKDGKLPCVVYCHCNSGSRRDAEEAVFHLLPSGIGVLAFDFAGSGLSDGAWVTLGAHEVDDLEVVVSHLRNSGAVSSIGLWGRSMGAVTALMYSCRDSQVAGIVLDSPFSRLTDLMLEIVEQQNLPIPKMMLRLAVSMMRKSVKKKAGFDITAVSPIDLVPQSTIPAVFGHGKDDTFISSSHSEKLQAAYGGNYKNLVLFGGDHNHPRPPFFYTSVCIFFHQQLLLDEQLVGGNPAAARALQTAPSADDDPLSRANGSMMSLPWELTPLSSCSSSGRSRVGSNVAGIGRQRSRQEARAASDWGAPAAAAASDDDDDAALAAAIEASLAASSYPHAPPAATSAAADVAVPAALRRTSAPASAEEEEEMLRQALALSLADASLDASCSSGSMQGSGTRGSSCSGVGADGASSSRSSGGGSGSGAQRSSNPWVAPGTVHAAVTASQPMPVPTSQHTAVSQAPHFAAGRGMHDDVRRNAAAGHTGTATVADVHAGAEAAAVHKGPLAPTEPPLATSPAISAFRGLPSQKQ